MLIISNVILDGVQDLAGSTTIDRLGDLEIFRFTQDDSV
jgi:hypothetical protein